MATAPQIQLRDGSGYTQRLVFSTNEEAIIIEGTIGVDTADVQVAINDGAFASDPDLVRIVGQTFMIPNLSVYPTGLLLEFGVTTIRIRAIDIVGGISATSSVEVTRVEKADEFGTQIPTGIRVLRNRNSVDILMAVPEPQYLITETGEVPINATFIGFNVYASTSPAGATGYYKLNEKPLSTTSLVYDETTLASFDDLALWSNPSPNRLRIRVTEEDSFGNELAVRLDSLNEVSLYNHNIRFASKVEDYRRTEYVSFRHVRGGSTGTTNSDQFVNTPDLDPLYYVVSAVYFLPDTGTETETPYSQEVLGAPLIIDTTVRDLPGRVQLQIILDYVSAIQRVNREITLVPGSTTRDVSIDPFASETERIWFLLDFVHRSQSFLTLLQIDDANNDGISDSVATSAYKQALKSALGLTSDSSVQALIDQQFDKLANNVDKKRLQGRAAIGQAVVYTTTRPTKDIPVPANSYVSAEADSSAGLSAVRFRIGGSFVMSAANADSYYNFNTKRYELIVEIVCEQSGTTGNRPAGAIKTISGVTGVSVTNTEATVFGTDSESNADLAARSMLGFVSVDTGTEGGYRSTTAEQVSIIKAKVVKSGDDLMMRDWDEVRKKHIGGKVDVWVQGLRERQVTEKFAFTFEIARDIRIQIIDLPNLIFRVLDSRVTNDTPIIEILNNPSQGLGVHNATTGLDYDLTGVAILDYETFQLSNAVAQPATSIDDIIYVDYRFRVVNQFYFSLQPVIRVVSCVGEVSGALDPSTHFSLYKTEDPLMDGESTIAQDYLSIAQVGGIPSGNTINVTSEVHVLIGFVYEPLDSIGINLETLRVFSEDRLIEYNGPSESAPDFEVISGTPTTPAQIVRTSASQILSGQTVSVDYTHDENFTVTYVINDVLQELQTVLNNRRHVTADVLAKQAVDNQIDIETTVQLLAGATKEKTDPLIRTNVSLELNRKLIGQGSAQSDIINAVDSTKGVDYEVVPLARMAYADGSRKLREGLLSTYTRLPSLDIGGNRAYLLTNELQSPTTDGGGLVTEHKGVFQDDEAMSLASDIAQLCTADDQAYIIGYEGAIIAGFTDDVTLAGQGFTTPAEQQAERERLTANHVCVSLTEIPADNPGLHTYAVSYVIRGDSGAHDIFSATVEFIELGNLTVTFREAT